MTVAMTTPGHRQCNECCHDDPPDTDNAMTVAMTTPGHRQCNDCCHDDPRAQTIQWHYVLVVCTFRGLLAFFFLFFLFLLQLLFHVNSVN